MVCVAALPAAVGPKKSVELESAANKLQTGRLQLAMCAAGELKAALLHTFRAKLSATVALTPAIVNEQRSEGSPACTRSLS